MCLAVWVVLTIGLVRGFDIVCCSGAEVHCGTLFEEGTNDRATNAFRAAL